MGCGTSSQSANNVTLPQPNPSSTLPARDLYDRKDLIGVGNHGRVYRAVHQLTNKEYAVKVMDRLAEANPLLGIKDRRTLGERLKKLKNNLIAPCLEVEGGLEEVAVVMELAKEGTLKKYIQKNGKLPEEKASKIIGQVLQGLNYLHNNGILHKDLKPSNILLTNPELSIQLTDYAVAELYDQRLSGNSYGRGGVADFSRGESLPYMAPQVIRQEGISEKADVWSVGCTVIEMLIGKVPWSDINPKFQKAFKEITSKIVPPLPKDISPECKSFLERCLTINPVKRWAISQLLKHPFIPSSSGVGIQSQSEAEVDRVKASLEKTDTANRINSRIPNKKDSPPPDSQEENFSTPPSIEKALKKEVSNKLKVKVQLRDERQPVQSDQLRRLKEAVGSFKVKRSRDGKSIQNQDILPQIIQQEEGVILNNKRMKLKPSDKVKTEQTDISDKRQYRNSLQMDDNSSSMSLNHRPLHRPQWENSESGKLETEPALASPHIQRDMEYFKKPLKLLKRKLKARQKDSKSRYLDTSDDLHPNEDDEPIIDEEPPLQQQSKIRTLSQQRQELAINTQLAKAERDRYINQQLAMRRQKEKEKARWQEELKLESEVIKKEFSHRYAYQKYHPVLNMI